MKKSKISKMILILMVAIMCLASFGNLVYADTTLDWTKLSSKTEFSAAHLLNVYLQNNIMGNTELLNKLTEEIAENDLTNEAIIKLTDTANDGVIDTADCIYLLQLYNNSDMNYKNNETTNTMFSDIMKKWNCEETDIEIRTTLMVKEEVFEYLSGISEDDFSGYNIYKEGVVLSTKTTTNEEAESHINKVAELNKYYNYNNSDNVFAGDNTLVYATTKTEAIVKNGAIKYNLVIGRESNGALNWYLVPETIDFSTDITYVGKIDNKEIAGKLTNGTYYPGYDAEQVEKDADVTVTITSKEPKLDILETNGVALKTDGKANSEGWYYPNVEDKTVIAKEYPFEDYNNLTDNGMVAEEVKLTGEYGKTDTQNVSIKWPFRIIDVTYNPEKITEETEKVTVTITTNLPIEESKLPEGWEFTDDEAGKTQHRIEKEYSKEDKDVNENVIVTANNRTDTDNTNVKINWIEEKKPSVLPQTGATGLVVLAIIAVAGYAIIKYRKLKGIKNI